MDIENWIAAAREGDVGSFNRLVEYYQGQLFHVAWQELRDDDEALDAAQEALLSAWQAVDRFEGNARDFRNWLVRIVVNACRDKQRYEKRRPRVSLEVEYEGELVPRRLPSTEASPEQRASTSEMGTHIAAAVASLPVEQREVVTLDQIGFSYAEIAAALNIATGTVKSRLSRARMRLRELLEARGVALEPTPAERRSKER